MGSIKYILQWIQWKYPVISNVNIHIPARPAHKNNMQLRQALFLQCLAEYRGNNRST